MVVVVYFFCTTENGIILFLNIVKILKFPIVFDFDMVRHAKKEMIKI